jgi:ABC-2 type transport system permease protein
MLFLRQLRWELRRLWRRPRTYVGLGATFIFEMLMSLLYRLPSVRAQFAQRVWRLRIPDDLFSGLSSAAYVTGDAMALVGMVFIALVAADIVAKEIEDGTLRMVFCRPVSRTSIFFQKLLVCAAYTGVLTVFVAVSALVLGMLLEGPGRLIVVGMQDGVLGALDFDLGLQRFALGVALLSTTMLTVTLLAFTLSCLPMKSGTAATVTIAALVADWVIRTHPAFLSVSPYCLTTRLVTWRQVFNDDVPWLRIRRNCTVLLRVDAALVLTAWWAFRRRSLAPR